MFLVKLKTLRKKSEIFCQDSLYTTTQFAEIFFSSLGSEKKNWSKNSLKITNV